MSRKIAVAVCAGLLVLSAAGTGYAAAKLPKNSVGTVQLQKNAVTGAKVKNGSLAAADLSAAARKELSGDTGPAGPAGPTGATGPAGPSTSEYAALEDPLVSSITGVASVVLRLSTQGTHEVTLASAGNLVVQGAVSIGNSANTSASTVRCEIVVDDGGGFDPIGAEQRTDSRGNSGRDEVESLALVAATTLPAGTYDVGISCHESFDSGTSLPVVRDAALTAIATGLGSPS